MFNIPLELLAFIAIVLGTIGRTYFPYLRKDKEAAKANIDFKFDGKFILTAIFSGIVTAAFVYPLFVLPANATWMSVLLAGFVFAWGFNDGVNKLAN